MKNESTGWMTSLRAWATFAVIVLHVSAHIPFQYGTVTNFTWMVANIYESNVRFCVPVFLMLSGALLLGKKIELNVFLKKRFSRILLPFIFWSCIYIIIKIKTKWESGETLDIISLGKFVYVQLRDGAGLHFWYIYMLIGIYLFIPIINVWVINSTKKEFHYFLILWFIVLIISFPKLNFIKPAIDITYFSGYIGYPILGYYLTRYFNYSNTNKIALLFIAAGTFATITGTYLLTKTTGVFDERLYGYLTPNVLVSSAGVFLFFKSFRIQKSKPNRVINFISTYSYGVYCSHILVLFYLGKIGINAYFINPAVGIVVTSVVCLLSSAGIIYVINKLPYGKYISG